MAIIWINRPARPPIEEVRCPNCSARKATVQIELRDPKTGNAIGQGMGVAALAGVVAFFAVGNLARVLFGATDPVLFLCITLGATITALFGTALWLTAHQARATRVRKYRCLTCGHQWTWQEGTPRPRREDREVE